jgi:uncharacterized protein YfaS (alpha-2-macroglobulin family)
MKLRHVFAAWIAAAFSTLPALADKAGIHLVVESPIQPTSTFEVRFEEPMVAAGGIGKAAESPVIIFRPEVKGSFVWLSQRSGTFKPEAPLALSTNYRVNLAPGLKAADGQLLDGDEWSEKIETPPMQIKGWNTPGWHQEQDASAEPKFALLFNVNVDPEIADRFCKYVNDRGAEVAARVVRADPKNHPEQYCPVWRSSDRSLRTWKDRFSEERKPGTGLEARLPMASAENLLWVSPVQPLAAGHGWRLTVGAGLPASDEQLRLLDPMVIKIGDVQPFTVRSADATNYVGVGRRLALSFSKNLGKEVTADALGKWFRIEPVPANLKVTPEYRELVFTGDFELSREYRVIAEAGLPAAEPFTLGEQVVKAVTFHPIEPRLYFEEFATHQLSTGTRQFHFLSVNIPKVRVTARLLSPDTVPIALTAWEDYEYPWRSQRHYNYDEPYQKLDLASIPGQTIWQQEIETGNDTDEQKEIPLDWNEILGANKTGAVLLTIEQTGAPAHPGKRPGSQAIVQVTDLGVVWKLSRGETFVHVFSLATGKAVAGAKVRLLDAKNQLIEEVTADEAGLARLKAPEKSVWIMAQNGGDTHLVDFKERAESLSLRQLGIREESFNDGGENDVDDPRQALLFTERPVYKPGETVHLKGILRDWRDGQPRIPAGAKARLHVTDAQNRAILNRAVTISDTGSFAEDIKLPAGGLGTYQAGVIMEADGPQAEAIGTQTFEVQEYVPNAFEINIAPAPRAIGETEIELPVTAQYYMGKPLSTARLAWTLTANDGGFAPAGFAPFDFCNAINNYRLNGELDRNSQFSDEGKTDLDARGGAKVKATIPINPKAPQPRTAQLICEITDLDEQTVSRSAEFTIHSSDFYLGIRRLPELFKQGDSVPVDLIAVRTDGTPNPELVPVTLRLTRMEWENTRIETAGGAYEYRDEARFDRVSQTVVQTRPLTKVEGKWAVAAEGGSVPLVMEKPGQYLLEALSKDKEGREVATSVTFNVSGEGYTEWDYRNQYQIDLVSDKEEYRTGQVARVLVKTPIAGEALVTVEREKVLRSFVTTLSGNAPSVEVPLEDGDAPNVYVSVMMLRGATESPRKFKTPEYRVGYCKLNVVRPDSKLAVYVQPGAPSYRPGDEVRVGAQVLDAAGKPVANAEVTLYAVDEGVLSLMEYKTPDPLTFFQQERGLAVSTGLTLPTLLTEDPENRSYANKGYLVGGGGETAAESMRKNFVACALWNGSLRTDAEGRVAATFTAPDSLTRYRVMAVVQTARDQFGSGESAFEVNKPVMLEPALPRFANVGDKLVLRGVLHNLTDADGEVEVKLQLDATASAAETTRQVHLPAHASLGVDFPVEFNEAGKAVWKWTANFTGNGLAYRDVVQSTLNVGYPVALQREVISGQTHEAQANLLAGVNPGLLEGAGVVRVSITNSRVLDLRESVEQLLHYPYGCVEQTTSSTLPWVSMRDFQRVLPSLRKTDDQITGAVNHGVDRLLSMQTSSGGLSYWPGEKEPLFWGSAYGGFGLATARRAGFEVPQEAFDRLCKYLSEQLRGTGGEGFDQHYGGGGPSDRCLALYTLALADRAEPAYHELLYKKRDLLSPENRALLALAILESNGPKEMVAELLNSPEANAPVDDWFWSPSRDTALRLLAWTRHQPNSPAVGRLSSELMGRRIGGHWVTTQGNCWSLLALGAYFRNVENPDAEVAGTLTWQNQEEKINVNRDTPVCAVDFPLTKESAVHPLRLANPEKRQLFTEVVVEARPRTLQQPRQDQGYSIHRTYSKIEDDGSLTELKEPRVGDRVLVTLDVGVRKPANYLAVDDPLPSIFEAVNPVFKSQATRAGETLGRDWLSSYQELREDRALFFADHIYPGEYTIRYLARVRAVGTATAPSAKVEEMYHPERFGMTETVQITSVPLK